MAEQMPEETPKTGRLKESRAILIVALIDVVVIAPYTFWRLSSHRLGLVIAYAGEGVALLSMLGIALYLRRRGR